MKILFKKPLNRYVLLFLLTTLFSGMILLPFTENIIILFAVLSINFIILVVFFQFLFTNYIKPLNKATKTLGEMNKGNFSARFHHSSPNILGELSIKINSLARHLSEFSIQEKIQREQLSTIIENTENGLVLIDEKGYIHLVNRKFLTMYGGGPRNYNGYLYYEVLEHNVYHDTVQQAFLYEKNVKNEFSHYIGIDKFYFEIVGVPVFNNNNNRLKGAILVIHDITEMKKLELMRKDFVANVSHELRTPITSIRGFAETLLDTGLKDTETANEFLKIIYNESDRLQLLIEELLTLSKLEEENFQLVLHQINVEELIKDITTSFQMRAKDKNIDLSIVIEENLEFKADKDKVKQIIVNLLDNAINYTSELGKITLNMTSTKDEVHIKVTDTGIGIDQESIPRIFERFYRVDKARSRNTGGTGLGLAIVKHIVDVHDGKIEIESEVDQGTTVHVYLPKK
ncbi:two-component system histidine kinase PnpS [Oceanobacillus senegalensis]|uniref:two-component system histidine kinase PnpS n=1 Tax=Oceanobacillus senegalensis TaxID=1936063 RepID=UPI000A30D312|nr:HAMP domain-containing sensor histidine kinase [Oceanobacillus senegalensis]